MSRFLEQHKAKVARKKAEARRMGNGRNAQMEIAKEEAERIARACDRPASFNMVLCQSTPPASISPARFAAMVRSIATGSTNDDDTMLGILTTTE